MSHSMYSLIHSMQHKLHVYDIRFVAMSQMGPASLGNCLNHDLYVVSIMLARGIGMDGGMGIHPT